MSNDETQQGYGPSLYAYLSEYWRAHDTNQNAWCDQHPGIQAPTVSRWRTGTEPRLSALRDVADALGRPLLEILVAAGILTPEEAGGYVVPAPEVPSIDAAIKLDPNLSDLQRRTLRDILKSLRDVESGRAKSSSFESGTPGRRRRKDL